MSGKYLLGIDVGTYSSKGVLTDEEGRVLAYHFVEHSTFSPRPGWYEHDAEQVWWGDLVKVARALLEKANINPADIAGVGMSALCADMLPLDEDGRPLRNAILYGIDLRATEEIAMLNREIGEEKIYEISGNALSNQSVGPKILWFRRNEPELFLRARMIHSASSYLAYKLTGRSFLDYATAAFFSPLFDIHRLVWDEEICRFLEVPQEFLPETCWATGVVGGVTKEAAEAAGLAPGTPVIAGTVDAYAEAVSVGMVEAGEAVFSYGSTMNLLAPSDRLKLHPKLLATPYSLPNKYILVGATATAGALTRWFRDNFAQVEMETERNVGINAYHLLSDQAAEAPPGSSGLLVLPYFAGERCPIWDAEARGLILGLTLSHTRRHLYRALLEGTAYSLRHNLETFSEAGAQIERVIASGGGTLSRTWLQIVSDVTGFDQELVASTFGSPYGDAFLAGYGVGLFSDARPLRTTWVQKKDVVKANPALKPLYDRYYQVYRKLYEKVKESMHTLARLSQE